MNHASNKDLEKQAANMVMTEEEQDFLASIIVKGRVEERRAMAVAMLADGEPIEKIVKYSRLSKEEVLKLRESGLESATK